MSASLANRSFVSVRQLANEIVGLGPASGIDYLRLRSFRSAIGDIFANGSGKQERVLQDDANVRTQRFLFDVANVVFVERNPAARRIIKSRHKAQKGALTGTSSANQGNDLVR